MSGKSIAIIGCGAAGLAALRVFSETIPRYPYNYKLFGFERSQTIGGLWNYSENYNSTFSSPLYKNLKTNSPKEILAYPDLSFPDSEKDSFISHQKVLKYLENYAKKYDLLRYIQCSSNVTRVEPLTSNSSTQWKLTIEDSKSLSTITKIFDIILICNGHFDKERIPKIKNLSFFKGEIFHSKFYRIPEKYVDKTVFVLGAMSSGKDIAFDLIKFARKVYLSHNQNRNNWKCKPHNLIEVVGIQEIDVYGRIGLTDGSKYDADIIIFCTGYDIDLSFLTNSCNLSCENAYVTPLYKHFINPYFPKSFFIIGLGYEFVPFTHFYMQSKVARAIVQNCSQGVSLSTSSMLKEIRKEEQEFRNNSVSKRHIYTLDFNEWPFLKWCESVACNVMSCKIPEYLETLFSLVKKWRSENNPYRELRFKLVNDNKLGFIIENGPEDDFYSADYELQLKKLSKFVDS